jgi:hypothetical protein
MSSARFPGGALSQIGELLGVGLPGDEGLQDRPPRAAQNAREDAPELQVRVFEGFLDPQGVLGDLPHQLAGACEITQLLDRRRGHEARTDQPVRQQVRTSMPPCTAPEPRRRFSSSCSAASMRGCCELKFGLTRFGGGIQIGIVCGAIRELELASVDPVRPAATVRIEESP